MVDLHERARTLTQAPKGILAADESNASADKRLSLCGIAPTSETRRKYRELFLDAPGIEDYLSGVILYEETLTQTTDVGESFPALLRRRGIMPGIKVDTGTEPLEGSAGELITNGLIGLPERLETYVKEYGTEFTKWRAVITIQGDKLPTDRALVENARRLGSYAKMVQEAGMVPMLEPEVLYDGTHSLIRSRDVITRTLSVLVDELIAQAVDLQGVVIKSSMALSGKDTGRIDTPEEVARETLASFMASVPKEIPGIVFLSGGQESEQATQNLSAIHTLAKKQQVPWNLTFSYARAIQQAPLEKWKCIPENVPQAREEFLARLEKLHVALS